MTLTLDWINSSCLSKSSESFKAEDGVIGSVRKSSDDGDVVATL